LHYSLQLILNPYSEPIGGSIPKFSTENDGSKLVRGFMSSIALTCPAQGYPLPGFRFVLNSFFSPEPIGGSKPKFSSDIDSSSTTRKYSDKIALTCSAQAFPLPMFR